MSVALREQPGGKLLVIFLSGTLTAEDYERFTPHLVSAVRAHGQVRVLVRMHHFHGWTAGGQRQDVTFDPRHLSAIERLALVGEKRWEAGVARFCKSFPTPTTAVRYFDEGEADEADRWIHDGIEQVASLVDPTSGGR